MSHKNKHTVSKGAPWYEQQKTYIYHDSCEISPPILLVVIIYNIMEKHFNKKISPE